MCSPPDGFIHVAAQGGSPPYAFRINNSDSQPAGEFGNLQGGVHEIEVVDASGCTAALEVVLLNFSSGLAAIVAVTPDTECLTGNGKAQFKPTGGAPPYQLKFQNVIIENALEVGGLQSGKYQALILDSKQCEFVMQVEIPQGQTATSWSVDIKPIIDTRCAKPICHVTGTGRADLTKLSNVQQLAAQIKSRTGSKSMPFDEPMPSDQIQLIACWVDDGALNN